MNTSVETTASIISFEEPDLVRSISKPQTELTLDCVLENSEAAKNMVKGQPFYLIIVTEETATYTKEAREYIHPELELLKKGEAIVVTSLPHRILGTYYARTRRKHHAIRLFATEWEALEWIDSLRAREAQQ